MKEFQKDILEVTALVIDFMRSNLYCTFN